MNILVCGSRTFSDTGLMGRILEPYLGWSPVVIAGGEGDLELSKEDEKILNDAGWFWSEEDESWVIFA